MGGVGAPESSWQPLKDAYRYLLSPGQFLLTNCFGLDFTWACSGTELKGQPLFLLSCANS